MELFMKEPVSVLLIEDSETDAELTLLALQNGGFDPIYRRVDTSLDMQNAIASQKWDCIISDYSMPHFNGLEALSEFKKYNLEIPFLIVSGTMGEDIAVNAMKEGAHDYIIKGKLSRLAPALKRELKESELRRQKKLTEEALRKSEEHFRILFEQASDGIFIADRNGNFIDVNPSGSKMLGYDKEDILKMNISSIEAEDPDLIPFRIGELSKGNILLFETKFRKKNNELLDVEINGKMLPDGRLQGIVRNITDRKKVNEEISLLAHSLKSINECVSITDLEDNCIFVNNAFLNVYGYNENEIVGKNINIVRSSKNPPEIVSEILPASLHSSWSGEIWNRRKDGSEFLISLHTSAVKDEYGRAIALIGVAEDITIRKKMLDEIRENEQRLRVALSSIDIAVFNQDINLVYTWMYQSQLGYTPDQVVGLSDADLLPKDTAEKLMQIKRRVLERNQGDRQEVQVKWSDKTHIFDLIVEPLHNSSGQVVGITGASLDISERKLAEEALQISEKNYRTLFNSIPVGLYRTSIDGKVLNANPALMSIMGIKDIHSIKAFDVLEGYVNKADRLEFKSKIEKEGFFYGESQWRLINGTIKWLEERAIGIRDESGKILYYDGSVLDITDRKKAEEKIIASELQFRSVWENSFDAMRLCDEKGTIVKVNSAFCKLVNKSKEQLENHPYDLVYNPEENDNPIERYQFNFKTRSIKSRLEAEIDLWDKRKIWIELSNSYVEIKDQPILLLSIFHDITVRMQSIVNLQSAKQKAEEMNKLKSSFLANMSHELRTPMIGILGFSEILSKEVKDPEQAEMVETINSSGKRLLDTLNMLLDLSRIEANREEIKLQNLNIENSIRLITKTFEGTAKNKGLNFNTSIMTKNISAMLDERLFGQIINNLLNNAIKFTKQGSITVQVNNEAIEGNVWAVIKVIDTGIGIPKESLQIIFEEFRQASEGLNRSYEGTGLGLTITKKSVELMNGTISVESKEGIGSTFTVRFPSVETDLNISHKEINRTFNNNDKPNIECKVLIVENDKVSIDYLRMILKKYYSVDTAGDGQSAIKLASENNYSIIFMDIGLGFGMNGLQTTAEIRKISGYEKTPIVAITAYAMKGDKENFLSQGITHYLSKPYTKDDLMNLVNEILQSK